MHCTWNYPSGKIEVHLGHVSGTMCLKFSVNYSSIGQNGIVPDSGAMCLGHGRECFYIQIDTGPRSGDRTLETSTASYKYYFHVKVELHAFQTQCTRKQTRMSRYRFKRVSDTMYSEVDANVEIQIQLDHVSGTEYLKIDYYLNILVELHAFRTQCIWKQTRRLRQKFSTGSRFGGRILENRLLFEHPGRLARVSDTMRLEVDAKIKIEIQHWVTFRDRILENRLLFEHPGRIACVSDTMYSEVERMLRQKFNTGPRFGDGILETRVSCLYQGRIARVSDTMYWNQTRILKQKFSTGPRFGDRILENRLLNIIFIAKAENWTRFGGSVLTGKYTLKKAEAHLRHESGTMYQEIDC